MSRHDDGRRQGLRPNPGPQRRRPGRRRGGKKRVCKYCADKAAGHRLQGPAGAQVLHQRARQGRPPPHQRQLRAAPAQGDARHQAGAQHRALALHRHGLRGDTPCLPRFRSSSSTTSTSVGKIGRAREGPPRLRAKLPPPALSSPCRRRPPQVHRIEHEKAVALAKSREAEEGGEGARRRSSTASRSRSTRAAGEDGKLFGSVTAKEIESGRQGAGLRRSTGRRCTCPRRSRRSGRSRSR